ncbi:MAG: DUF3656 domain-containing protein [Clostridia bacterium]|nr:DUF3656 domain-containing protein [Clostridia bacterium]
MINKAELLAPAGNYEAFLAAVENGADAVYLGGRLFNARQFAGNFDNEQLKKALEYAHIRDTKIYLAMNTLISDEEMEEAVNFAGEAYTMGIDGIIVQDLGFAGLIRKGFPDLELHASTQMTVYNLEGVKVLEQLGFHRAVLARELSLNEIEQIAKNTPLEIEVFVHGALCISYSGQCLMSSMIGGRSGNRGKCAQPCRLPYELVTEKEGASKAGMKGHLMSPKDLSSIEELEKLIHAGVKSLKIEGRMKTPEYVATVVRIYRKYLDRALENIEQANRGTDIDKQDLQDLTQIFNRGGFSKGYLYGKSGKDMMSYEKPKNWGLHIGEVISHDRGTNVARVKLHGELSIGDGIEVWNGEDESPGTIVTNIKVDGKNTRSVEKGDIADIGYLKGRVLKGNKVYKTSDKGLNERAQASISGKLFRRVNIHGNISIKEGNPILLRVEDTLGNKVEVLSELVPEKALNKAVTKERIIEQLKKTGSTPFDFIDIEVELDENLALPVSELNNLRRMALEDLELKRRSSYSRQVSNGMIADIKEENASDAPRDSKTKLSVFIYNFDHNADYSNLGADRIYIPFKVFVERNSKEILSNLNRGESEIFVWLPSITRGRYDALIKDKLEEVAGSGISGFLIGSLGSLEDVRKFNNLKIIADFPLNIFNRMSLKELSDQGIGGATLSPELTLQQIEGIKRTAPIEKEVVIYGRLPVMTSEYCPVGSIAGGMEKGKTCNAVCKKGVYKLKDRMGMEFPVLCDPIDCRSVVFNSNVLLVPEYLNKIRSAGVNTFRMNITDEKNDEIRDIIALHKDILKSGKSAMDKHRQLIEKIRDKGFTKGHYFRGV